MIGRGVCQIRPSSLPGAVSWAMAKPWVGRSLTTASTVHSASDNDGPALMSQSVMARPGVDAVVTDGGGLGSLVVTSQVPTGEAGHVRRGDQHGIGAGRRDGKDWLSRHLGDIDPAASAAARQRWPDRWDAR
jgi:hypothetical protein